MPKLNIGCDRWHIQGFINLDICAEIKPDLIADAIHLPFPSETFDEIYAGHVLEHIPLKANILLEWRRVMKPGADITLVVPDVEKGLTSYRNHLISLDTLNKIVFGSVDRPGQFHFQVFTSDIILECLRSIFKEIHFKPWSPYLVSQINWQTIVSAKR